jgi:hypothetical protein
MSLNDLCQRVAAGAILTAALAGCDISIGKDGLSLDVAAGRASDTWTRSYEVAPEGRLEIVNMNGRIEVFGSDGPSIELTAERTVKARSDDDAKALLAKIEMAESAARSLVRIEARVPRQGNSSHEIRYTVKVPRSLGVEIETTNGGLSVNGVHGSVRAVATNGGFSGRALGGGVTATTTNGGIRVEFARIQDQVVTLDTINGGIEIRLPPGARAALLAQCTNGSVTVSDFPMTPVGHQSRRRVEAQLNGGGAARIDAETVNGGITITGTT